MKSLTALAALCIAVATLTTGAAHAGPGHDHGESPAVTGSPALPRFALASELFELVGVLNGRQLTLYLDHYADNRPVKDARLELDVDGKRLALETRGDGEFEALLAAAPGVGVLSIVASVVSGKDSDLLAGELEIADPGHSDADAHTHGWMELAPWALGSAALVLAVATLALRRRAGLRRLAARGGA